MSAVPVRSFVRWTLAVAALLSAIVCARFAILHLKADGMAWWGGWVATMFAWLLAWFTVSRLSAAEPRSPLLRRLVSLAIPLVFGATLVFLWEVLVRGLEVRSVLLPPPSMIWERITTSLPVLAADFRQTFLKAVLAGYALGCGSGFLVALWSTASTSCAGACCPSATSWRRSPSSASRRSWSCGSASTGRPRRPWWS